MSRPPGHVGRPPAYVPFNITRPANAPLPGHSSNRQPNLPSTHGKSARRPSDAYQKAKSDYVQLLSDTGKALANGQTGEDEDDSEAEGSGAQKSRKRQKRSSGKACVYCRRSHMVCEGGRPCERCVKRDISHLCRDVTPPPHSARRPSEPSTASPVQSDPTAPPKTAGQSQLPPTLYSDPNFPPAWPLLPDGSVPTTYGEGSAETSDMIRGANVGERAWRTGDDSELGALTKFLVDLGIPSLPGNFLDVLSYFGKGGGENQSSVPIPGGTDSGDVISSGVDPGSSTHPPRTTRLDSSVSNGKGKAREVSTAPAKLGQVSRIERYFLAAADQPSGPRAARLAQVIKAKYDAGLLKPYDYIKGYERMNKWMDSGRAAPKADSMSESQPSSPQKGGARNGHSRLYSATPVPVYGSSISQESRRRILAALNGFRPKFRQIARTLTDVDLVFIEEAMERWMLEYDRAFASIHTPSCIWRRTGEIQKANQEFANLTGIPASMFRNGVLCVYELMDEDSAVRYWEGYAKIAFDAGQRALYTSCTLKVPMSLTRRREPRYTGTPSSNAARPAFPGTQSGIPDLTLPQSVMTGAGGLSDAASSDTGHGGMVAEEYREIKCSFSVTIRRDAWGVPVAIMGQWIVSLSNQLTRTS